MLATELPANRPQQPHPVEHVNTRPVYLGDVERGMVAREVDTPLDLERRTEEEVRETNYKPAGEILDKNDPHAPFGATGKDAEGNPITSADGKEADPLALAGLGANSGAADNDAGLGDGSLTDALRVMSEVRRNGM
ncbi:hypothetical protein HYH02_000432 [Chlamydomonas schloesseri]|uniref:Uncharacterized protein n=1 Tax=Chlamydomonas schloesseri TaxID=2026947 RepID=A0A835WXW1_9CHLO|nr:hypothetical protein HYH02_000432 [Chlamydomonas schloesseri]|eukprot:KAG2454591.1 hypothetical protein HYH02_000432 [Chlamydomonas schloesseri]